MNTIKRAGVRTRSRDVGSALVDAAEVVLVRDGPAGVTVRAVAAEAGVAPMGVYSRFGSKEGLVDALLVRGFQGLRKAVAAAAELDPVEQLRESGMRYRLFALAHREQYGVMFGGLLGGGEPSEELAETAGAAFQELVNHAANAMAAGRLIPGDPREVAQQIWSAVHGAVTLEIIGRTFAADPEASYRALLGLLIRGLSVPPAEPEG
ncbi:MAG TPA: TetR/AcrR family transcriptional regulator [Kineosporiaceae bacterium]|nr:TetR/AcrR family transcriptional regulator [Kineosporiaceae bacterium]